MINFFNKFKKTYFGPTFGQKAPAPCKASEKTNEPIPKNLPEGRKGRLKSWNPSGLGSKKGDR